jgi:hypothetical protein
MVRAEPESGQPPGHAAAPVESLRPKRAEMEGQPRVRLDDGREGRFIALTEAGDASVQLDGDAEGELTLALLITGTGVSAGTWVDSMDCEGCGEVLAGARPEADRRPLAVRGVRRDRRCRAASDDVPGVNACRPGVITAGARRSRRARSSRPSRATPPGQPGARSQARAPSVQRQSRADAAHAARG